MNQVRARLTRDHEEMRALLQQLAEDAEAPSRQALEASWDALEGRLLRHMEAEERYLLPLLEAGHPASVQKTRAEHGHIRDVVAKLGLAVQLHTARKPDILQLIELLNQHSSDEDHTLYQLAGDKASGAVERGITAALKGLLAPVDKAVSAHAAGRERASS
jgi:hemerythrin-like domain-containing protein